MPIDDQSRSAVHPGTERKPWTTLVLLGLAQFMVILDITVVNVALPSIADDLAFAEGDLQWVITAYVLFTGGLLMLGGRASDLFGRRRVFLAGLATFTVASLASGLASSPETLVAARAVQGLGAALLTPGALAIVTTTYEGRQRTAALAAWSAIGSGGAAAGVVLGGILTSGLGWEWVFFINVPVGLIAGIGVLRVVPDAPPVAVGQRLDILGTLTAVAGLVVLVYGIEGANEHGWGSARTIGLLGVSAVLLATFVGVERRVAIQSSRRRPGATVRSSRVRRSSSSSRRSWSPSSSSTRSTYRTSSAGRHSRPGSRSCLWCWSLPPARTPLTA
jgi:MFS family permease